MKSGTNKYNGKGSNCGKKEDKKDVKYDRNASKLAQRSKGIKSREKLQAQSNMISQISKIGTLNKRNSRC